MEKMTAEPTVQTPVWGCVLIGGRSSRMGTPKHLLRRNGLTWLELTVQKLMTRVEQVVLSGRGEIPASLAALPVVADAEGINGPLAGLVAMFRWRPGVSWLISACDLPDLDTGALDWLLSFRGPGVRAVLPDLRNNGQVEPLLAFYDWHCRELLEELVERGSLRLSDLVGRPGVITPQPPEALRRAWRNINTPGELKDIDNCCQSNNKRIH
jgi:molybdopterin-guanine dinucleotide biosynthesis protein A